MSTVCHKARTLIIGEKKCIKEETVQSASSSVSKTFSTKFVWLRTDAIADKLPMLHPPLRTAAKSIHSRLEKQLCQKRPKTHLNLMSTHIETWSTESLPAHKSNHVKEMSATVGLHQANMRMPFSGWRTDYVMYRTMWLFISPVCANQLELNQMKMLKNSLQAGGVLVRASCLTPCLFGLLATLTPRFCTTIGLVARALFHYHLLIFFTTIQLWPEYF